jgi:hypothetical protein
MFRSAASKVMWVGRATVFMVGLTVILALVLGVASTALGADGKQFLLGRTNLATAITTLVKQGVGPALSLKVDSGPPLAVNSSAKVDGLNADAMDGLDSNDFVRGLGGRAYTINREPIAPGANATLIETDSPHLRLDYGCPTNGENGPNWGEESLTITNLGDSSVALFVSVQPAVLYDGDLAAGQSQNFQLYQTAELSHFSLLAAQNNKSVQINAYIAPKLINSNVVGCPAAAQALELQS